MLCFLIITFLVSPDVILDILVLLEEEPEHAVQFLSRLDLHLGVTAHRPQLLFQTDDALDVVRLERRLVGHDVVVCADEVLLHLVVEGLTGDLYADTKHDLDIDHLLLQCSVQDSNVSLTGLFQRVVNLVLHRHDLVQMNLVIQVVVVLQTSEGLQHLFDLASQVLDQVLVFNSKHVLLEALTLLGHTLLLVVHDGLEN